MTQPNTSELANIIGAALEQFNDPDYGYDIHPDDLLEVKSMLVTRITANYTPNTKVLLLESRIAWLEGKLEGLTPDPLGDVFEANGYTVVDCTPKNGGNK